MTLLNISHFTYQRSSTSAALCLFQLFWGKQWSLLPSDRSLPMRRGWTSKVATRIPSDTCIGYIQFQWIYFQVFLDSDTCFLSRTFRRFINGAVIPKQKVLHPCTTVHFEVATWKQRNQLTVSGYSICMWYKSDLGHGFGIKVIKLIKGLNRLSSASSNLQRFHFGTMSPMKNRVYNWCLS